MERLERELRQVMTERAGALTTAPPMPSPGAGRRPGLSWTSRRALAVAMAAALALLAGVAIAQVMRSNVTPVSDRFVVASGETPDGPWRLTLYRAQITQRDGRTAMAWCLDLDGPSVDDPGASTTDRANVCRLDTDPPLAQAIGPVALFPFSTMDGVLYGEVSAEVASVEARLSSGDVRQASLASAPTETNLAVVFWLFAPPGMEGELVARDRNGDILETIHVGG